MKNDPFKNANFGDLFEDLSLEEELQQFTPDDKGDAQSAQALCEEALRRYDRMAELNEEMFTELKAKVDEAIEETAKAQPQVVQCQCSPKPNRILDVAGGIFIFEALFGKK